MYHISLYLLLESILTLLQKVIASFAKVIINYTQSCARGYSVDYRSFIKFECEKAAEEGLQIVVLYKSTKIDRDLCPMPLRYTGFHQQMIYRDYDGHYYWDDRAIQRAMRG